MPEQPDNACSNNPSEKFQNDFGPTSGPVRRTCEEFHQLRVNALKREGLLNGAALLSWQDGFQVEIHGGDGGLLLSYEVDGEQISGRVIIDHTPGTTGGQRAWFLCPKCLRRVGVLYAADHFRCRHCHDLRYASQRETVTLRAIGKAQRIRQKLGGSADLTLPRPSRPKFMQRRTYKRLVQEEINAANELAALVSR
jgi:hypothetical protein